MAVLTPLNVQVMLRRDTLANWELYNPIPLAGEACFALDANILKVGDGERHWTELPPIGGSGSTDTANYYMGIVEDGESDMAAIARIVGDEVAPKKEDVCILKKLIADNKYSYNVYVYGGSAWLACNGLYNAKDIYFDQDFIVTKDIGEISLGDNTYTTLEATGRNLVDVMDTILKKERNPKVVQPSWSAKFTNLNEDRIIKDGNFTYYYLAAGDMISPTFEFQFNPGSYEFGPATGVEATNPEYMWYCNVDDDYHEEPLEAGQTQIQNLKGHHFLDSYVYVMSGSTEGAMPITNLENEYPEGKIAAKADRELQGETAVHIIGFVPIFYGMCAQKLINERDDGTIEVAEDWSHLEWSGFIHSAGYHTYLPYRYLKSKVLPTFEAKRILNPKCALIAIPTSGYYTQIEHTTIKHVTMPSAMNIDITSEWHKVPGTFRVYEDANPGSEWDNWTEYDLYVYQPAVLDPSESYQIELA